MHFVLKSSHLPISHTHTPEFIKKMQQVRLLCLPGIHPTRPLCPPGVDPTLQTRKHSSPLAIYVSPISRKRIVLELACQNLSRETCRANLSKAQTSRENAAKVKLHCLFAPTLRVKIASKCQSSQKATVGPPSQVEFLLRTFAGPR